MTDVPVLLLIFNRPEPTKKVFNRIRAAKPRQLFIVADGPRNLVESDKVKCAQTREVVENVDWPCEVKTLFREENLGCGVSVPQGISWFFEHVPWGVILEDDCLPDISFFKFCQNLLERYQNHEDIMLISGTFYHEELHDISSSYFFSRIPDIWGWATWKRAWEHFDFKMQDWDNFIKQRKIENISANSKFQDSWIERFEEVKNGQDKNVWSYQWIFSIYNSGGICIRPAKNLITNIGFGKDATHTTESSYKEVPSKSIYKIKHPLKIKVNRKLDERIIEKIYGSPRKQNWLKKLIPVRLKEILLFLLYPNKYKLRKVKNSKQKGLNGVQPITSQEYSRVWYYPENRILEVAFLGKTLKVIDSSEFIADYDYIFKNKLLDFELNNTKPNIVEYGSNTSLSTIYLKFKYPDAKIRLIEFNNIKREILNDNLDTFDIQDTEVFGGTEVTDNNETSDHNDQVTDAGVITDQLSRILKGMSRVDLFKVEIFDDDESIIHLIPKLNHVENILFKFSPINNYKSLLCELLMSLNASGYDYYILNIGKKNREPFKNIKEGNSIRSPLLIFSSKKVNEVKKTEAVKNSHIKA